MPIQTQTHPSRTTLLLRSGIALFAAAAVAIVIWQLPAQSAESVQVVPAAVVDEPAAAAGGSETAVIAGGCFWGVQGVFQHVKGVRRAVSGYAGGGEATAQYEVVSSGQTGHAESVEITYDPKQISYGQLLQIFFSVVHDPTQLDRQGPDHGTQYRSAIFPQGEMQQKVADAYVAQLNKAGVFHEAIVTKTAPLRAFYPAEHYHQDYLTLNPNNPYIRFNDIPKVENLKKLFPERYREQPVLVSAN